jgi:hypothetical protein
MRLDKQLNQLNPLISNAQLISNASALRGRVMRFFVGTVTFLGGLVFGLGFYWILIAVAPFLLLFTPIIAISSAVFWLWRRRPLALRRPRALIVEDDPDMGSLMKSALSRIGFEPELVTETGVAHRRISFGESDLIFLDWKLAGGTTGDRVLEESSRLIGIFPSLKESFRSRRRPVVTYSSLFSHEIDMPKSDYFEHIGHWHKSMPLSEFKRRAGRLLTPEMSEIVNV